MEPLFADSVQLSDWAGSSIVKNPVIILKAELGKMETTLKDLQSHLEKEIEDYAGYHNALQEIEKWLLTTSFQLMAHNSLCITNREQTLEQITIHENLLQEIEIYQTNLNALKDKGNDQISRYKSTMVNIEPTTKKQLKNVQDSYDSLLHTGKQIKKRLLESLDKFQQYEDTLDSIMNNLNEIEPKMKDELKAPIESIDIFNSKIEYIRVSPNIYAFSLLKLIWMRSRCMGCVSSSSKRSFRFVMQ